MEEASDTTVGLVYDIGGRGDLSFNDSAYLGLEAAQAELGIEFTQASPNNDGSDRGELLQLAADGRWKELDEFQDVLLGGRET